MPSMIWTAPRPSIRIGLASLTFQQTGTDRSLLTKGPFFLNLRFDHATGRNCQHRGRGQRILQHRTSGLRGDDNSAHSSLLDVILNDKLKLRRSMQWTNKSVLLGVFALGSALVMALHRSRRRRKKCVETLLDDGVAFA
jgi:hypothetical protein